MGVGNSEILVVEQPSDAAGELQGLLQVSGFNTTNVATEDDCLSQIRNSRPDLILLSLNESGFDALSLIREILKIDAALPIILTSVNGDEDELVSLLEAGATDILRFASGQGKPLKNVIEQSIKRNSIHKDIIDREETHKILNLQRGEKLTRHDRD